MTTKKDDQHSSAETSTDQEAAPLNKYEDDTLLYIYLMDLYTPPRRYELARGYVQDWYDKVRGGE